MSRLRNIDHLQPISQTLVTGASRGEEALPDSRTTGVRKGTSCCDRWLAARLPVAEEGPLGRTGPQVSETACKINELRWVRRSRASPVSEDDGQESPHNTPQCAGNNESDRRSHNKPSKSCPLSKMTSPATPAAFHRACSLTAGTSVDSAGDPAGPASAIRLIDYTRCCSIDNGFLCNLYSSS